MAITLLSFVETLILLWRVCACLFGCCMFTFNTEASKCPPPPPPTTLPRRGPTSTTLTSGQAGPGSNHHPSVRKLRLICPSNKTSDPPRRSPQTINHELTRSYTVCAGGGRVIYWSYQTRVRLYTAYTRCHTIVLTTAKWTWC